MADVNITKSKSITIRGGVTPSNPVIPETPSNPVEPNQTPIHNQLNGLQGGQSDEYYHLTEDEYDAVLGANAPDGTNPFATMADVGGGGIPPIDGSYTSQANMIADQVNQTAQYIYFDGTAYWEYLGTTTPSIADYRQISGGGSDTNKVSYNIADGKTASEKQQARDNIGLDTGIAQIVATAANINNLARTNNLIIFTTAGASYFLTGMSSGLEGERVTLVNKRTVNIILVNESGLSSANNRFSIGVNYTMTPEERSIFVYDSTLNRWVSEWNFVTKYLRKDVDDIKKGQLLLDGQSDNIGNQLFVVQNLSNNDCFAVMGGRRTITTGSSNDTNNGVAQVFNLSTGDISDFRNSSGRVVIIRNTGRIIHARSGAANESVLRDELPFNYPQTVATAGIINNLSLTNEGIKLLILTAATDLTGVVPVSTTTGRELKIEGRVGGGVIIRHESASSTAENRFTLPGAVDLTIANGEVYTFIYTNGRWRRAL